MRSERTLLVFALGVGLLTAASESHSQTPSKPAAASVPFDGEAVVTFNPTTKALTVAPNVALIHRGSEFRWLIGELPADYTVEIDFRVHEGAKGPFGRLASGAAGRYTGRSKGTVPAGAVVKPARDAWKYDVVVRDGKGEDVAAIDPMVIIAQ